MIARPIDIIVRVVYPNYLQVSVCNERAKVRIDHLHLSLIIKTASFEDLPMSDFTKPKSVLDNHLICLWIQDRNLSELHAFEDLHD